MGSRGTAQSDLGFLGTWSWSACTGLVHASDQVNKLFGLAPNAQSGLEIGFYEARVHPDDLDWLRQEHPRCFGPSGQGIVEYRVFDDAGEIHWVLSSGLYTLDPGGRVETAHGMMIDVTAFKSDGNDVRTAPTFVVDPLQETANTLIRAHRAAVQTDNTQLQFEIELALTTVGMALAKDFTVIGQRASLET